ncbi:MAG: YlbF family regulator [Lachnospiraceae bacterium]
MSDKVMEASDRLNTLILESEEYQKYCLYKKELEQMPELRRQVQEFRKRNFEVQLEGDVDDMETAARLAVEYKAVLENPMAASYLNAELCFCKMMQTVTKNICRELDLELEFL